MYRISAQLMRSAPGWVEVCSQDNTRQFQNGDAVMTIFPNGNWRCVARQGLTQAVRQGSVSNLEQFLKDFAAVNSCES
jgi:hypothetical protein